MAEFLTAYYPWIKAFHVISVIAWMAAFLYLPRLFVYHVDAPAGSERSEMLKIMERRLLRGIMNPSMIAALIFGGLLLATPGVIAWADGWIHAKLMLVAVLIILHMMAAGWRRAFAEDRNTKSAAFYRIMNEIPAVVMIGIVILVIVRPF